MTKTDHLARAKDYIAIAESGDAKLAAYRNAAREIKASGATQTEAASVLGRDQSWVQRLLKWDRDYADAHNAPPPFGGAAENEARYQRADRRKVEDIAAERPEVIAEVLAQASPDTQRRIADELVKQPTTERSLKSLAEPRDRKPREPKSIQQKLGALTFDAWELGEALLDYPLSDEERIHAVAMAEKLDRLVTGILRSLGTGEFEDEFRELLAQVEVEA